MSENNGYITADALDRFADARKTVDVEIDGFGKFRLREWRGIEREEYLNASSGRMSGTRQGVIGLLWSLVDANGDLMFEPNKETIDKLMLWPHRVLEQLAEEMLQLNGMLEPLEETAKNSEADPNAYSGTN